MGRCMGDGKARQAGQDTREDRLKKALKANLQRRKAQARARQVDPDEAPQSGPTGHITKPDSDQAGQE